LGLAPIRDQDNFKRARVGTLCFSITALSRIECMLPNTRFVGRARLGVLVLSFVVAALGDRG